MQSPNPPPHDSKRIIADPDFTGQPKPITDLVVRPDFPQCTLGEFVDIRGYAGVVVEIVHNSMKVRSPEGLTQSFNFHRLRTLYAPVVHPEATERSQPAQRAKPVDVPPETPAAVPASKRNVIVAPNYAAPVKRITEFARRVDFPRCLFGEHVEIAGFKGVVVEIVNQSVKVKSEEGVTRSYNAAGLRNLYGQK